MADDSRRDVRVRAGDRHHGLGDGRNRFPPGCVPRSDRRPRRRAAVRCRGAGAARGGGGPGCAVVVTMLPTAHVVNSVIFAGGVAQALADGAVWAQMGTIGLAATTAIGSRPVSCSPMSCSWSAGIGQQGPRPGRPAAHLASGPPAAPRPCARRSRRSAQDRRRARRQGSRMKLVVNAYMSVLIQGVAEALELAARRASMTPSWPRPSRAARWTHRSRMPSCTRWSEAISRPSSRWSGRSRMWTWRSRPPAMTSSRSWPRCPTSGTRPLSQPRPGRHQRRPPSARRPPAALIPGPQPSPGRTSLAVLVTGRADVAA